MAPASLRHRRVAPNKSAVPGAAPATSGSGRLRTLLLVLVVTTLIVGTHQVWRLYQQATPLPAALSRSATEAKSAVDAYLARDTVKDTPGAESGTLPVQFEEDGELDMATMQRMLDILYQRPAEREGYEKLETDNKHEYRFRKEKGEEQQDIPLL